MVQWVRDAPRVRGSEEEADTEAKELGTQPDDVREAFNLVKVGDQP